MHGGEVYTQDSEFYLQGREFYVHDSEFQDKINKEKTKYKFCI
jgi:hypothetical protein